MIGNCQGLEAAKFISLGFETNLCCDPKTIDLVLDTFTANLFVLIQRVLYSAQQTKLELIHGVWLLYNIQWHHQYTLLHLHFSPWRGGH